MDVWAWICELPMTDEWPEEDSFSLELAREHLGSIMLKAERTQGSNSEALVRFSIYLSGFDTMSGQKSVWVSDASPLTEKQGQFLPLVLQLLQETVSRSPGGQDKSLCPRSTLQRLKPDPVIWLLDSHSTESFSTFFNLIFITRLFWLCVSDSPVDVGSLYFHGILGPNIQLLSSFHQAPVLKKFLISVGVDVEICFMRTLGYILAKWFILREVNGMVKSPNSLGFSYATESHGFWTLKGYAPIGSMRLASSSDLKANNNLLVHSFEPTEAALRYSLAHQQLEVVIQLEYTVTFLNNFIQVNAHIDNIRVQMTKLGFTKYDNDSEFSQERHFPSRIRVWVGPEVGASYVAGLSLSKSTENVITETECSKTLKGSFGSPKVIPKVKSARRTSTISKTKAWRWDQEAEGNAAVFDTVLCDPVNGLDVGSGGGGMGLRKRYSGASRVFSKTGGLVLAGDEYGNGVGWRVGKEMEGSVLTWRIGGEIWVSYWASEVKSGYWENRCVEWCDEVDLPLIPTKTVV